MNLSKISILIIGGLIAVFLAFTLGKCSGDAKVIYKPSKPDIIFLDSGKIDIKVDTLRIAGKAKIIQRTDTLIIIRDGKPGYEAMVNNYAKFDTVVNVGMVIHQKDSLNKIDTIYNRNLRLTLNNKFRFYDSTFHFIIIPEFEQLSFITKTVIKYTEPEPLHWTRSDYFLAFTHTATAVGFFYLGTKTDKNYLKDKISWHL